VPVVRADRPSLDYQPDNCSSDVMKRPGARRRRELRREVALADLECSEYPQPLGDIGAALDDEPRLPDLLSGQ
jgi:hypothetical protein